MACAPCQKKALERQKAENAKAMAAAINNAGTAKRSSTVGCNNMYDALSQLDKDIVRIYKQNARLGELGYETLGKQRTLRIWMADLPKGCPPEAELSELRTWISSHL